MGEKYLYKESFRVLVLANVGKDVYLGTGNPDAQILMIGREGATEEDREKINERGEVSFAKRWLSVVDNNEALNYMENYSMHPLSEGHTWSKYQKLHDYIFGESRGSRRQNEFNFKNRFFTTEMNVNRAKKTQHASVAGMQERKNNFFGHEFIQQFPVVVLACGNYITNQGTGKEREIDTIFGVTFREEVIALQTGKKKYSFWIHRNDNESKLVIHTRQLSTDTPDRLLQKMAETINDHLNRIK